MWGVLKGGFGGEQLKTSPTYGGGGGLNSRLFEVGPCYSPPVLGELPPHACHHDQQQQLSALFTRQIIIKKMIKLL